jgi:hypothetical protein
LNKVLAAQSSRRAEDLTSFKACGSPSGQRLTFDSPNDMASIDGKLSVITEDGFDLLLELLRNINCKAMSQISRC